MGQAYRFEVDMFAFGVVLFRLLSGEFPFSGNSEILKHRTIQCRYNVKSGDWQNVSPAAKGLIRKLLINRQERLTAADALCHRWFREERSTLSPSDLTYIGTPIVDGAFRGDGQFQAVARVSPLSFVHWTKLNWSLLPSTPINLVCTTHLQSQASHYESISRTGGRFWIDAELQFPIVALISVEIYSARQVDERRTDQGTSGLICMEELTRPECMPLPDFILQWRSYTEKDCRNIMLQVATAIKTMHDAGMAHRNLNLNNIVIDPSVSGGCSTLIRSFWPRNLNFFIVWK